MISKIWFDITNTPQVHFLLAIQRMLSDEFNDFIYTARDFSETISLLGKLGNNCNLKIIDSKYGTTYLQKLNSILSRISSIRKENLQFDLSISCGSDAAVWHSWLKGKRSIAFGDNDTAKQWTYAHFVDFAFFPDAIDRRVLEKQGLRNKLIQYHGFKEDIYISYFQPDQSFMKGIPFDNYIVVRPENIHANYLKNTHVKSIVPSLLSEMSDRGYKIVYLPRYSSDWEYAKGIRNVHIPSAPLNGIDLCYNADAVLTGAGTLAREAACLGIPSFSFYSGRKLLAVDRKLINERKMIHSRDVYTLLREVAVSKKIEPDLSNSIQVREELKNKLVGKIKSLDN